MADLYLLVPSSMAVTEAGAEVAGVAGIMDSDILLVMGVFSLANIVIEILVLKPAKLGGNNGNS